MSREKYLLRPDNGPKYGVYVIRAGSKDEAEKIAASDPYTAAGFSAFELLSGSAPDHGCWPVHIGRNARTSVTEKE